MTNKSKEEAIRAVTETVAQIGEPLRNYISSKDGFKNFLDVNIKDKNNNNNDLLFDVLIDQDHVKNERSSNDDNNSSNLTQSLREYGAVIIKIVE